MSENNKNTKKNDDLIFVEEKNSDENELIFAEEKKVETSENEPWKIMIVDDEVEVHNVTKLALKKFKFEDKPIKFISAYSGEEAKQLIAKHPNIAAILLDVIMETDDAGLRVVEYIRKDLKNQAVQIIIRTGQPGQVPEDLVSIEYDINDYKAKTELTRKKLFGIIATSLRGYKNLKEALEKLSENELSQKQLEAELKRQALEKTKEIKGWVLEPGTRQQASDVIGSRAFQGLKNQIEDIKRGDR